MSIAIAAIAALALPAAAQAVTYDVVPGQGPCMGDTVCGTLTDAAAAINAGAGTGDVVNVPAGTFDESPTFSKPNVTITGAGQTTVVTGTITFSGGAGTQSVLQKAIVVQSGAAAAVAVNAASGLAIRDAIVVSQGGHGVAITAGNNTILRAAVAAGTGSLNAVDVRKAETQVTDSSLTLESSTFAGGGGGAGVSVITGDALPLTGGAGDVAVNATHITVAGSARGIDLDSTGSQNLLALGSSGNITANVSDSIVLGESAGRNHTGIPVVTAANIATLAFDAKTDRTSPAEALFVNAGNKNFHLRADAPAVDAAAGPGASPTDIDGEPRTSGPASDLGGDEFVNKAPTAKIVVKTALPRDGQPVTFDASGTTDQVGDKVAVYAWNFGDGQSTTTTTPEVTHTYMGEGPVTARLVAVDLRGAQSTPASTNLTILDGGAPSVTITKPKNKQKLNLFVTKTKTVTSNGVKKKVKVKTKKRTRIKFAGKATDKSGVARVILTVEKTANAKTTTVAQGSQSTSKKCRWLDPKKGLKRISCAKPILILVKVKDDGSWAYNVRKSIKLSKGTYRAIVYGLDKAGSFGNSAAKAKRNIKFTIK